MEVMVKAVVWLWPLTVLAKGGEWPIIGRGGGRGHGELVGEVDGRGYLSVGQCGVHAGDVQVAAVVRPLAPVGRHKSRHPAAVGVAQGLAFLCAVRKEVSTWREVTDRGDRKWKHDELGRGGKVGGRLRAEIWGKSKWGGEVEKKSGTEILSGEARWGGDERETRRENTS